MTATKSYLLSSSLRIDEPVKMPDRSAEKSALMQFVDNLAEQQITDDGLDPETGATWSDIRNDYERELNALVESHPPQHVLTHFIDRAAELYEIWDPLTFIEQEIEYLKDPELWRR